MAPGPRRARSGRRPPARRRRRPAGARHGRAAGRAPASRTDRRTTGRRGPSRRPRRLGFPGQLEGPRADQPVLPVARRQVGGRPLLRQLAGLDELRATLVGLAPQERRGLGDVARLVEHEERARSDVVETGRRGQVRGPDLGGIADDHRPARGAGRIAVAPVVRRRASVSNRARSAASRSGSRAAARPSRSRMAVAPPAGSRNSEAGRSERALDGADRALVGRVERAERVDLVAEELDPDRQRQRRREDVDDAAPARRLATAGDLGDRDVAEVEQLAQERVLVDPARRGAARAARPAGRPGRSCAGGAPGRSPPSPVPGRSATRRAPRRGRPSRRR